MNKRPSGAVFRGREVRNAIPARSAFPYRRGSVFATSQAKAKEKEKKKAKAAAARAAGDWRSATSAGDGEEEVETVEALRGWVALKQRSGGAAGARPRAEEEHADAPAARGA